MAVYPLIPLAGKQPDMVGGFQNAMLNGQNYRHREELQPLRMKATQAGIESAELGNTSAKQGIDANERALRIQKVVHANGVMKKLRATPKEQRGELAYALEKEMYSSGIMGEGETIMDDPIGDDAWLDAQIASTEPVYQQYMQGSQKPLQFGPGYTVKDSKGNEFMVTQARDSQNPSASRTVYTPMDPAGPTSPIGGVSRTDEAGRTVQEVVEQKADIATDAQQIAIRNNIAKDAFESIGKANKAIANIDTAIKAIDDGANTGPVDQWFPSFKTSTIELQNAANRMGLDIIGAVTFGALSAGEMKLAMSTAMPQNMQEDDLKAWLQDRKRAQHKLRAEMVKSVQHFESNGSLSDYLDEMKSKGAYIDRNELPMITTETGYNQLSSGAYYLSKGEDGTVKAYRKK